MNSIEKLANKINQEFNDGKQLENMGNLLKEYDGTDWSDYVKFSEISYNRNLVFRNDIFEIMVICWNYDQHSCIHDHPNNGCFLKALQGDLIEECYEIVNGKLIVINKNNLSIGSIAYQKGTTGIHRIINPYSNKRAITLHIYSPPNYKFNSIINKN